MLLGESSKRFYTKSEEERNPTVPKSDQEATDSESVFSSEKN